MNTITSVVCPTCGSKMESKMVRQLFSLWTAGSETDSQQDSYETVERSVCLMHCPACGYEEYELPQS